MFMWVPRPRMFPYRCFASGQSSIEHGPYLEMEGLWIDPKTRTEGRQYWSFNSWRTSVLLENSPYRNILEEAVDAKTEELQLRIMELEEELAKDPMRQVAREIRTSVDQMVIEHLERGNGKPAEKAKPAPRKTTLRIEA